MPEANEHTQPNPALAEETPMQTKVPAVDPNKDTAEVNVSRGSFPAWLIDFAAQEPNPAANQPLAPAPLEAEENLRQILLAELEAEEAQQPPAPEAENAWANEDTNPTLIQAIPFSLDPDQAAEALLAGELAAEAESPAELSAVELDGLLQDMLSHARFAQAIDFALAHRREPGFSALARQSLRPYLLLQESATPLWQLYDDLETDE